ncbi:DUF3102 domain-containing protein [Desulfosporosinus fructosivorans]
MILLNFIKEESGKMLLSNAVEIRQCLTEAKEPLGYICIRSYR